MWKAKPKRPFPSGRLAPPMNNPVALLLASSPINLDNFLHLIDRYTISKDYYHFRSRGFFFFFFLSLLLVRTKLKLTAVARSIQYEHSYVCLYIRLLIHATQRGEFFWPRFFPQFILTSNHFRTSNYTFDCL